MITWAVPEEAEYDKLAAEWTDKKWRMLPKPGGAVMKPDDWYCIWGAQQQVEKGDNADEKPMWAHHGEQRRRRAPSRAHHLRFCCDYITARARGGIMIVYTKAGDTHLMNFTMSSGT